jgi:hypothetical protein
MVPKMETASWMGGMVEFRTAMVTFFLGRSIFPQNVWDGSLLTNVSLAQNEGRCEQDSP